MGRSRLVGQLVVIATATMGAMALNAVGIEGPAMVMIVVPMCCALYTLMDVALHEGGPMDRRWLRRRVTINLVSAAAAGIVATLTVGLPYGSETPHRPTTETTR